MMIFTRRKIVLIQERDEENVDNAIVRAVVAVSIYLSSPNNVEAESRLCS